MFKHDDWAMVCQRNYFNKWKETQIKSETKKYATNQSQIKIVQQNAKPKKKGVLNRLLSGTAGNLRKLYLYAMGGANIDLQKLESRAQSLAPFIEYTELAKNHKNI